MIAIPNMEKPKNCAECFRILKCKSVPRWVTADDSIPKGCPLIEIDDEAIDIAQDIMDGCKKFKERRADE